MSNKTTFSKNSSAKLTRAQQALLTRSVSSLTPAIEDAGFDEFVAKLDEELKAKDLNYLNIEIYFGDEWFCPDQTTTIAVPFWLADEKLKSIERLFVGCVEGETSDEFMRLLRHEAGHCVEHAYKLSSRADWRAVFGDPTIKYNPDSVPTIEGHPDFVINLDGGYAQTHPEEDFAETFAVWLDSDLSCWNTYRDKPVVLNKLFYVEALMAKFAPKNPCKLTNQKICQARRMRRSLESYYRGRLI